MTAGPAGETVGEMSLIAGSSNHNAQLVALRDTELLRISPDGFEALRSLLQVIVAEPTNPSTSAALRDLAPRLSDRARLRGACMFITGLLTLTGCDGTAAEIGG